jgi:hypothetical protein
MRIKVIFIDTLAARFKPRTQNKMKHIFYILLILISLVSCEKSKEINLNTGKPRQISRSIIGNPQTKKRFDQLKKALIIEEDSLRKINFLNQRFKEIKCKRKILVESEYENQIENTFIQEYSIMISDSIEIKVLQKKKKLTEYIYTYRDKPFKIKNYYGEMFVRDSDIFFAFDTRRYYKITEDKYLMREQPMRWCGLANQFDMFQIIDLNKMEMTQFADRDSRLQ